MRSYQRFSVLFMLMATGLSSATGCSAHSNHPNSAHSNHSTGDVIANLFEWNWKSVAAECKEHLGPAGFGAVQVAPPAESVSLPASAVRSGSAHPWWEVYQPVSYNLTSRMGTRAQFGAMVTACHRAGVRVIVDAVINHMAASNSPVTTGYGNCTFSSTGYTYPCVPYGYSDFHHPGAPCPSPDNQIRDWKSTTSVQECELESLSDLYTEKDSVRTKLAGYLNDLISLGVDGLRVDAAKHIAQADMAAIEAKLNKTTWQGGAPYIVQEVRGDRSTPPNLQYAAFEGNGSILNFDYADDLQSAFTGSISGLNSLSGLQPSDKSLSFVTIHDTERDGSTLNYKNGNTYKLATYFLLAYPYGTPQVYDGFDFSSKDQSPPANSSGFVTDTVCGSGWECIHRSTGVAGMVGWHNAVSGTSVGNWTATNSNVIAFSRGSAGWIAINNTGSAVTATYTTGVADGTYCDVITGTPNRSGCTGTSVRVSGSSASVTVPANGAVAIDVKARSGGGTGTPTPTPSPTLSVNDDATDLTFNETATTTTGTKLYVVGSIGALGSWNPDDAIPLSAPRSAADPVWSTLVIVPKGTTFSYKYIEKDSAGNVNWESGANRSYTTGPSTGYTANDTWK